MQAVGCSFPEQGSKLHPLQLKHGVFFITFYFVWGYS